MADIDLSICLHGMYDDWGSAKDVCELHSAMSYLGNNFQKLFKFYAKEFRINLQFYLTTEVDPHKFVMQYIVLTSYLQVRFREYMLNLLYMLIIFCITVTLCYIIKRKMIRWVRVRFGLNQFPLVESDAPLTDNEVEQLLKSFARRKQLKFLNFQTQIHLEFDQQDCPFCLEKYNEEDQLVLLNCKHAFHRKCNYFSFPSRPCLA